MKTGIVIDEPKRDNGKTRFTMFWRANGRNRAQCFDAVLEEYLKKDPGIRVYESEALAKEYAGCSP